ncbi:MAG TPA: hypothetical protein VK970_24015 [Candidatus Methylacidiphilales bacterium]|nr:hypothetical protein [Candidatus Methylacidiphilales bacterium]
MDQWGPVRGAYMVGTAGEPEDENTILSGPHPSMIPFISRLHAPVTLRDVEAPDLHEELVVGNYLRENNARALFPWRAEPEDHLVGWLLIDVDDESPEKLDEIAAALALLNPRFKVATPDSVLPVKEVVAWLEVDRFGLIVNRSPFGREFTKGSRIGYSYTSLRSPASKDCLYRGLHGESEARAPFLRGSRYEATVAPGQNGIRLFIERTQKPPKSTSLVESCLLADAWTEARTVCNAMGLGFLPKPQLFGAAQETRVSLSQNSCTEVLGEMWRYIQSVSSLLDISTAKVQLSPRSSQYLALDIDIEWLKQGSFPSGLRTDWLPDAVTRHTPAIRMERYLSLLGLRLQIQFRCSRK